MPTELSHDGTHLHDPARCTKLSCISDYLGRWEASKAQPRFQLTLDADGKSTTVRVREPFTFCQFEAECTTEIKARLALGGPSNVTFVCTFTAEGFIS